MNLRPSGYEPDELPGCSTPRFKGRRSEVRGRTKEHGSGLGLEARRDGGAGGRARGRSALRSLTSGLLARPGDDPLSHP